MKTVIFIILINFNDVLKKVAKWHETKFPHIPIKVPSFLFSFLITLCLIWKFHGDCDGMCGNLISELSGIIITVYIVELFLFKRDKENNHKLKEIINGKIRPLVPFIYFWLLRALLNAEPDEKDINYIKVKGEFEKRRTTFTGKDYVRIMMAIKKLEQYVDDLLYYFEKYTMEPKVLGEILQFKAVITGIQPLQYEVLGAVTTTRANTDFQKLMIKTFNEKFLLILDIVEKLSEFVKNK